MTVLLRIYKKEAFALIRILMIFGLVGWLPFFAPELGEVVYQTISDAYVAVSVWVGLTLIVFYTLEKVLKIDFATFIKNHKKSQILIAAFLGGVPGCGGSIIVTTQYIKNNISFGALVATLTATMGDAAFLLIAKNKKTALYVIGGGVIIGTITGYIVDALPNSKWIKKDKRRQYKPDDRPDALIDAWFWKGLDTIWMLLLIPGFTLTIANAMNVDIDEVYSFISPHFGFDLSVFLGSLTLAIFFARPSENNPMDLSCRKYVPMMRRIVAETSFVAAWVLLGFLIYDITIYVSGFDLKKLFATVAPIVPLIGVLIGWMPGCGPQIVVTTLYINGIIPFSALMGNAISNDGDALFPAIAIAPRAGVLATLYSTVPALIVAYTIYFINNT